MFCLYQVSRTGSRVPLVTAPSENEAVVLGKMLSYLHATPVVACEEGGVVDAAISFHFMAGQLLSQARPAVKPL